MQCVSRQLARHVHLPLPTFPRQVTSGKLQCGLSSRVGLQAGFGELHGQITRQRLPDRHRGLRGRDGTRRGAVVCRAGKGSGGRDRTPEQISSDARLRSEVIAPFRSLRIFFYLAFIASAGVGGLIALTRVIGALGGAPNAGPLADILKDVGIDLGAVVLFALLYRSDKQAETKSIAKITREENLSKLRVELSNKRIVSLRELRGIRRALIVAGSKEHIEKAFQQAEPFKSALVERGVLVVPLYLDGSQPASSSVFALPSTVASVESAAADPGQDNENNESSKENADLDKRFVAAPLYTNEWTKWLRDQMQIANVEEGKPVYISLRMDGRVRASGVGFPPVGVIAAQLPPVRGIWAGPLDGLDGRV